MTLASFRTAAVACLLTLVPTMYPQSTTTVRPNERPAPPVRDPHTPGYVQAKELPDGVDPPANADGNFIIGPTHNADPEL
jgi:enterochelin esterase family protein